MTMQTAVGVIPQWTLGDRLKKARQQTGLTTREFAVQIGVSQKTVTDAENDKHDVRRITILMWSAKTGVPLEWLESGETSTPQPPDGGESLPTLALRRGGASGPRSKEWRTLSTPLNTPLAA